jgi:hypothetical protein
MTNPYAPPQAPIVPGQVVGPLSQAEAEAIKKRISKLNGLSLLFGGGGLVVQAIGNVMRSAPGGGLVGTLLLLAGTALLIYGLSLYARMRSQSPWFGLFGLLSCIGMIVLLFLPKKCMHCGQKVKGAECAACGAPGPK